MKQIILLSTILELPWLVLDGFMEETDLQSPPKKEIRSPNEEDQQEIRNFHSPKLPDTKKN